MAVRTVLLVDDDFGVLEMLDKFLANKGFKTLKATTPDQALRVAEERNEPISLLITDIVLPGMSGISLATRLQEKWSQLRVIYISGQIRPSELFDSKLRFLRKPFRLESLEQAVKEQLSDPTE
jgi:DNA-binding NtrC family response regulator